MPLLSFFQAFGRTAMLLSDSTQFITSLFIPEYYPAPAQVVRTHFNPHFITRQNTDIIHPHLPRNSGQDFVPIFQFYLEHRIAQCLYNNAILFNECLFCHIFWVCKDTRTWGNKEKNGEIFHFFVENNPLVYNLPGDRRVNPRSAPPWSSGNNGFAARVPLLAG